jgi:hypothetical protein
MDFDWMHAACADDYLEVYPPKSFDDIDNDGAESA